MSDAMTDAMRNAIPHAIDHVMGNGRSIFWQLPYPLPPCLLVPWFPSPGGLLAVVHRVLIPKSNLTVTYARGSGFGFNR